jgi:glycosyltransferase involved in cell wall biosynthesis
MSGGEGRGTPRSVGGRISVVHDYFTQQGGAERVVATWVRHLRPLSVGSLVADRDDLPPSLSGTRLRYSPLQTVPLARTHPGFFLAVLPFMARRIPVDPAADVLLVSTSGFAHGTRSDAPRVVYWHTPPRWLYAADDYRKGLHPLARLGLALLRPYLLAADRRAARIPARHLANSQVTRDRLARAYGIEAEILHPPVDRLTGAPRKPEVPLPEQFFLTVGRSRGYKNTDVVAAAAERAGVPLVVVGGMPPRPRPWPATHVHLPTVSEAELKWLYGNALALVSAAREDFGLTPIEANHEGTPAILLRAGGFLETLVPGVTGDFFDEESAASCAAALTRFRADAYDAATIRRSAHRFTPDVHLRTLSTVLRQVAGDERVVRPRPGSSRSQAPGRAVVGD